MNEGAVLLAKDYLDAATVQAALSHLRQSEWRPTWEDGSYGGESWRAVKVIEGGKKTDKYAEFPMLDGIVERLGCHVEHMMFYSLLPGGVLHPHRDMSGAVGLGGLRFHMPLVTNPGVDFRVSGKRVTMLPGELWALDTSYVHAVSNRGQEDRVHLVLEVKVDDHVRAMIPKLDHRYYLHQL